MLDREINQPVVRTQHASCDKSGRKLSKSELRKAGMSMVLVEKVVVRCEGREAYHKSIDGVENMRDVGE